MKHSSKDCRHVLCPICQWRGRSFLEKNGRPNVLCPKCGSFERHRHQYAVLLRNPTLLAAAKNCVLHVAPEDCLAPVLRTSRQYTSLDIRFGHAEVCASLTDLPFVDSAFDLIWCSHVLEHLIDVSAAISEIHRVLQPTGIALLDVPIVTDTTVRHCTPQRHGHVWSPGPDWFDLFYRGVFGVELYYARIERPEIAILPNSIVALCMKH